MSQELAEKPRTDAKEPKAKRVHIGWPAGRKRKPSGSNHPHVRSQRYSEAEARLLFLVVAVTGGTVTEFIHDAAVDRARQFADEGVGS